MLALQTITKCIAPSVTGEMNACLLGLVTGDEVRRALFQMHPPKSPGPNGMSPLFYQKFWRIVGSDVVGVVHESFFESGRVLKKLCYTHVVLIPKIEEPQNKSQLSLISLCNFLYKICAKVLTNHLKPLLSSLISPFQSAFIHGRLISDNSLLASEVSHFLHNKNGKEGFFALTLDLSEAYDVVE